MKLKSLMLLGLVTAVSSCANTTNEFMISKFYPLGAGCNNTEFVDDRLVINGFLDVAAGSPAVVVGVRISGAQNAAQQEIEVGETVLETADRNRPIITTMEVNYRLSKRVGGTPRPYIQNMTLPFSEEGEIFGAVQLLSPELGQALFDGLIPSPGTPPSKVIEDFVDINMDVQFRGEWSATRHTFSTGVLTYPVRAYRSNPGDCPTDANGALPFVRFLENTESPGEPDICTYVGFIPHQLSAPPTPVCCPARGGALAPFGC